MSSGFSNANPDSSQDSMVQSQKVCYIPAWAQRISEYHLTKRIQQLVSIPDANLNSDILGRGSVVDLNI